MTCEGSFTGVNSALGCLRVSSSLTALPDSGVLTALYYLLNPGIGTSTVTVNFTSVPGRASAGSASYFTVASVGSSSSNNGEGSPASIDVSSNAGDLVVDILSTGNGAAPAGGHCQLLPPGDVPGAVGLGDPADAHDGQG